jgi:ribosomal protein L11 methyltransferase
MRCLLAPGITVYPADAAKPSLQPGGLALAQLPQNKACAAVFGDGSHPTTRLCAGALDQLCRHRQPRAVLDVGTGTGVLARIARARGATFVAATDIDSGAVSCARAHADLDAHPLEIQFSQGAPDHWGMRFDLVVANILEEALRQLAPSLIRALLPGGVLLLSGFTRPQAPALRTVYEGAGLTFVRDSRLEEWVLLMFARADR